MEQEEELLLVAKTRADRFDHMAVAVKRVYPDDVPQVIAVPNVAGFRRNPAWIDVETSTT
jgi:uncharacterized protein involved in tolerance to divalent cations